MKLFREIVFWAHLCVGLAVSAVVLSMSVSGVLLTYERQILRWVDDSQPVVQRGERLSVDELLGVGTFVKLGTQVMSIRWSADTLAPVKISAGRDRSLLVDPYSGSILRDGRGMAGEFFVVVTRFHRWFDLAGNNRAIGRAVTGYSNLLFFFMVVSGIYLWLPKLWSRATLCAQVFFKRRYATGKGRDFAWHHVFAFWAVIPLLVMIPTAAVFYFSWAEDLVYAAYGEKAPARRAEPRRSGSESVAVKVANDAVFPSKQELLEEALARAARRNLSWRTLTLTITPQQGSNASFRFDETIGGQPMRVTTLELPGKEDRVGSWHTFDDNSPGRQARVVIRFLHTGEVLGVVGQTVAGLASLAACFLVWTGVALAWRRLARPLFGK